jgi:PAS domain
VQREITPAGSESVHETPQVASYTPIGKKNAGIVQCSNAPRSNPALFAEDSATHSSWRSTEVRVIRSASPERAFAPCSAARSKAKAFLDLWNAPSRSVVEGLLSILTDESIRTVARVSAQNEDSETIDLELLLLPLDIRRPCFARTLACWPR